MAELYRRVPVVYRHTLAGISRPCLVVFHPLIQADTHRLSRVVYHHILAGIHHPILEDYHHTHTHVHHPFLVDYHLIQADVTHHLVVVAAEAADIQHPVEEDVIHYLYANPNGATNRI